MEESRFAYGAVPSSLIWPDPVYDEYNQQAKSIKVDKLHPVVKKLRCQLKDPEKCLRSVYTTVDYKRNKVIIREELKKAINYGLNFPNFISDKDFEELMLILDPFHSNWINCEKFLELFRIDPHSAPEEKLQNIDSSEKYLTIFDIDDKLRESIKACAQQMLKDFITHDIDDSGNVKKPHAKYIIQKHAFPIRDDIFEGLWKNFPITAQNELKYYEFLHVYGNMAVTPLPGCEKSWIPHKLGEIMYSEHLNNKSSQLRATNYHTSDCDRLLKKMVEKRWREILRRCRLSDPRRTGRITSNSLKDILGQCGLPVKNKNLADILEIKYGLIRGTEINYWSFLRECVDSFQDTDPDLVRNMTTGDIFDNKGRSVPYKMLLAMRGQVLHYWRRLRQRFREKDPDSTGFIDGCDFRKILHDYSIYFSDEEYFRIMQYFDPHLTGEVPYISFLQTYANPILY